MILCVSINFLSPIWIKVEFSQPLDPSDDPDGNHDQAGDVAEEGDPVGVLDPGHPSHDQVNIAQDDLWDGFAQHLWQLDKGYDLSLQTLVPLTQNPSWPLQEHVDQTSVAAPPFNGKQDVEGGN